MADYYDDIFDCLESKTQIKDQIAIIDAVIASLIVSAAKRASKASMQEYQLNDGQTIIRATYTNLSDIPRAIREYQTLKQTLLQSANGVGRIFGLRDLDSYKK